MHLRPIEIERDGFPIPKGSAAITLCPFIFYRPGENTNSLHEHEMYHWRQQRRYWILPWMLLYGLLFVLYRTGKRGHPMERRAYEIQDRLEREVEA